MKFSKLWNSLKSLIDGDYQELSDVLGQPNLPYFYLDRWVTMYSSPPSAGHFGVSRSQNWCYCRELFHKAVDDTYDKMRYMYCLGDKMPKNTVELVGWVEDKLCLKEKTKFSILYDYKPFKKYKAMNILQVEPATFWWDKLPHSFLTCLLRASTYQVGTDHLDTMKKYPYFKDTWVYVERYLDGCTKYVGESFKVGGWYDIMTHCEEPEKVLVKP